ncbi:MAG: single-stranded DNA-binding protein [Actinomycetia bacterium]|nr:single-stranded DNA-binding protein [Actinomycetes bacterium]
MEAQVALTGRLGGDVDVNQGDGYFYARFRLGCTPRVRRGEEWTDDETTWIGVSASKVLARHVAASLKKGDPVVVVGRLRTRVWEDQAKVRHEALQIDASSVGHDLTQGLSVFVREPRAVRPVSGANDTAGEVPETPGDDFPDAAVDPATGEVLLLDEPPEEEELAA